MLTRTVAGAACALLLAAGPAFAVTVTNQYSKPQTVTVDRGATASQINLAPGKTAQVDCPQSCGFRAQAYGFSRIAGGHDKLVVDKDAELHFVGGHGDLQMPDGTS